MMGTASKGVASAVKPGETGDKYLVAYAKFVDDKDDGIYLQDVYFGGIANSSEEAHQLATECTAQSKGGIIHPRIMPVTGDNVLGALDAATARFKIIESQMMLSEEVYERTLANR